MVLLRRLHLFIAAAVERFYADRCLTRAAALAYSSLLSLVPLLAVMFSVLKGLGVQRRLEPILLSRLSLHQETTDSIIGFIDRTNVGTLGALGATLLLVTVVSVLGAIEGSLNDIWRVRGNRNWWRRVTDFLSVTLLSPFLLLAATALTSSLQSQSFVRFLLENDFVGQAMVGALRVVPIVFNIVGIAVLYAVMPNRRPSWRPILLGAVVAGTSWHFLQLAYVRLQIGVASNNAVYGALSQLPGLLAWLYVSWAVILVGAEVAATYELGMEASLWRGAGIELRGVALHLLMRCADAFERGDAVVSSRSVARELQMPFQLIEDLAARLIEWGWITMAADDSSRFLLARAASGIEIDRLRELPSGAVLPAGCDGRVVGAVEEQSRIADEQWRGVTLADVMRPAQGCLRLSDPASVARSDDLPPA